MTALITGTLLAVIALTFVLYPLLVGEGTKEAIDPVSQRDCNNPAHNKAINALREVEFDRETGKLSDADYVSLKASYTQRAIGEMRSAGKVVCERCGPRPEPGARFCSRCGVRVGE